MRGHCRVTVILPLVYRKVLDILENTGVVTDKEVSRRESRGHQGVTETETGRLPGSTEFKRHKR